MPLAPQIAVALGATAYLWNAADGSIEELCSLPGEGDYITSLKWAADSTHLAVGTSSARVQVWDAARCKQVKELPGHTNRVSSLAWNNAILSSGGAALLLLPAFGSGRREEGIWLRVCCL